MHVIQVKFFLDFHLQTHVEDDEVALFEAGEVKILGIMCVGHVYLLIGLTHCPSLQGFQKSWLFLRNHLNSKGLGCVAWYKWTNVISSRIFIFEFCYNVRLNFLFFFVLVGQPTGYYFGCSQPLPNPSGSHVHKGAKINQVASLHFIYLFSLLSFVWIWITNATNQILIAIMKAT